MMQKLKVLNHFHTDCSKFDSAALMEDMVKRAAELGAEAMAVTEHGNMVSMEKFLDVCKEYKIKAIPGVEAYFEEENEPFGRAHLVLHAMNIKGLHQIEKAVTASNENLKGEFPRMNIDILNQFFGPGSDGYGNVIATSACMQGVFGKILLYNQSILNKNKKLLQSFQEKNNIYDFDEILRAYKKESEHIDVLKNDLKDLQKYRREQKKLSEKKFTMAEKRVNKLKGTASYFKARKALDDEIEVSRQAGLNLKQFDNSRCLDKKRKEIKDAKISFLVIEKKYKKILQLNKTMEENKKSMLTKNAVVHAVGERVQQMLSIFGKNFWMEIQYHGIPSEAEIMPYLVKVAKKFGMQLIAANDAHMVYRSEEEIHARELMNSLRYNKWNPSDEYAGELYIKTDEELKKSLLKLNIDSKIVEEAMYGCVLLSEKCNVILPKKNHYPRFSNDPNYDANQMLEKEAWNGLLGKFKEGKPPKEYMERLKYEIQTIQSMGYADYHLIEKDFLEVGRKIGKLSPINFQYLKEHVKEMDLSQFIHFIDENQDYIGYSIGPGRGSAAGSLVCFCLGITNIDPIQNNLLFERFLNPERITMPDIDSDIHTEVRTLLIEYVKKKYGEHSICCIMTEGRYQLRAAIRAAGRVIGSRYYGSETALIDLSDKVAKAIPDKLPEFEQNGDRRLDENGNQILKDVKSIAQCENFLLNEFQDDKIVKLMISDAKLIEGRLFNFGMHAAGVVISDNGDIREYIALMYNEKKGQFTSQCDMGKIEENGLLKMDFLGLRNLDIITDTIRMVYERTGEIIDVDALPMNDPLVYQNILSKGDTNSVFQLESGGMKDMLRKFKPESFEDISLLVAMYRPGPMQYLDDVIKVKQKRKKVTYLTFELRDIIGVTYGAIAYQEQVQQIFQRLAGYSLGQADLVRRAMSKKKEKVLEKERHAFIYGDSDRNIIGCVKNNISEQVANALFDQMKKFAKYAFNKSHACAYAKLTYITAYLKYYHPLEYLTAVLNHTDIKKKGQPIFEDIHRYKIKLLPPDINRSKKEFTIYENQILFGLSSIPNIGEECRNVIQQRMTGAYISFYDFYTRVNPTKKVFDNLLNSGAFDKFGTRNGIIAAKTFIEKNMKSLKAKEKEIDKLENQFLKEDNTKKQLRIMEKLKNRKEIYRLAKEEFESCQIPYKEDDLLENLQTEYKLLGLFLTNHPMDFINSSNSVSKVLSENMGNIPGKKMRFSGVVLGSKKFYTKKGNKEFLAFYLEDQKTRVPVVCFPETYQKYKESIKDFDIIDIECQTGEYNGEIRYYLKKVQKIPRYNSEIIIEIPQKDDWNQYKSMIEQYRQKEGYRLLIYCRKEKFMNPYIYPVSPKIMENDVLHPEKVGAI